MEVAEQARKGLLRCRIMDQFHLSRVASQRAGEPYCTHSQRLLFSTLDGRPIALAHQYRRKDGKIGASGRPDPKRLAVDGRVIATRGAEE